MEDNIFEVMPLKSQDLEELFNNAIVEEVKRCNYADLRANFLKEYTKQFVEVLFQAKVDTTEKAKKIAKAFFEPSVEKIVSDTMLGIGYGDKVLYKMTADPLLLLAALGVAKIDSTKITLIEEKVQQIPKPIQNTKPNKNTNNCCGGCKII